MRRTNVVFPNFHRLPRKTVDQINHHGSFVIGNQLVESRQNGVAPVHSHHRLTHAVVKGLHAERKAIGAAFQGRLDLVVSKIVNASFDCYFAVVGKRQIAIDGGKHRLEIFGFKRRRRSAAEVDGVHRMRIHRRLVAPQFDFAHEIAGKNRRSLFAVRVLIEHAVKAARFAKRHMQVGKRLTVSRLLGESLKIVACLFSHQWHSARTGVNDRLGFKRRMKRVGCIGKKTLSRTVFELFAHLLGTGFKGHLLEFGTAVANGQLRLIFLHQSFFSEKCRPP